MLSQMRPVTPALYLPNGYGRYRQYPRHVRTPIPGAGYDVSRLAWAEQELNLNGGPVQPENYGNYHTVPLRGLGIDMSNVRMFTAATSSFPLALMINPSTSNPPDPPDIPIDSPLSTEEQAAMNLAAEIEDAARTVDQVIPEEEPMFLLRKVGPVPVWALGLGGIAVLGGGAFLLLRKKKVKANRRRRR